MDRVIEHVVGFLLKIDLQQELREKVPMRELQLLAQFDGHVQLLQRRPIFELLLESSVLLLESLRRAEHCAGVSTVPFVCVLLSVLGQRARECAHQSSHEEIFFCVEHKHRHLKYESERKERETRS